MIFQDGFGSTRWFTNLTPLEPCKFSLAQKFEPVESIIESTPSNWLLRSDNDGVFTSHKWKTYCVESGIKQQLTVPGMSSQNGVAERAIRTIITIMRALLIFAGAPLFPWKYAIECAVLLHAITPTKANPGNKCPARMCWNTCVICSVNNNVAALCETVRAAQCALIAIAKRVTLTRAK